MKNEAWILEKFLKAASLWADHIIIADQNSDDGSREIARSFEKVLLIENQSTVFNEAERQALLIDAARSLPGPRFLIALDADEFLTPNWGTSAEWQALLAAPKGTSVSFTWANISPDFRHYWEFGDRVFGFLDDGSPHSGAAIHSPRLPMPQGGQTFSARDIRVMHLQYVEWKRMRSKHRWYMAWERVQTPSKSAVNIFRQYHHMYESLAGPLFTVPEGWLESYKTMGVDLRRLESGTGYYWDRDVVEMMTKHGAAFFKKEAIWDIDWRQIAQRYGLEQRGDLSDPRSLLDRLVHTYLWATKAHPRRYPVVLGDKLLRRLLGW